MNSDAPVFRIKSEQDFKDFLKDLREAARHSRRNGGAYPVYRKGTNGATLVRIEVQFPIGSLAVALAAAW